MVRSYRIVLLCATAFILALLASCGGGGSEDLGPGSVFDQGDWVPEVQVQTVDHGFRVAGWSDLDLDPDPIFSLIASARSSLDIAVTRINRQDVVEAMLAMAQSGIQIRIVTEKAFYDDDTYKPFYNQLEDLTLNGGNILVRTDKEGLPRVMGSRFLVIDHSRVVTGSYNWETTDSDHTFGDYIDILNTDVAAAFTNQFNQMFVEGNFGGSKRDETQHTFLVGSAGGAPYVENGLIEVYFGPINPLREHIQQALYSSNEVYFMVQQFNDNNILSDMLGWLDIAPDGGPEKTMIGIINDIAGNPAPVVNDLMSWYDSEPPDGISLHLAAPVDPTGDYPGFDTMNHKHFYGNGGLSGVPTVVFSTGNYANPDLSQNDEVFLVFRGQPLVRKFYRGTDPLVSLLPDDVDGSSDIEEFDQVMAMFPYIPDPNGDILPNRNFADLPCGIIFGTVDNFREKVNMPVDDEQQEVEEIKIDLTFAVKGELFFGGTIGEVYGAEPDTEMPVFPEDTDAFERLERFNPDHEFFMVVPAGEITLITTVTELGGETSSRFEPDERIITIAPGGVRRLNLSINQQSADQPGGGF